MRAYLDHNATSPARPEARAAAVAAMVLAGNPSSAHREGRAARALVEDAREAVAALVDAGPREAVFTSGGTEANNLALLGRVRPRVLVSAVEHPRFSTPFRPPNGSPWTERDASTSPTSKRDSRPTTPRR